MRALIAVFAIWTAPLSPVADLPQRPYLSCIDGHIVEKLSDCPPPPKHGNDQPSGHGGGHSGLLGLGIGGIL